MRAASVQTGRETTGESIGVPARANAAKEARTAGIPSSSIARALKESVGRVDGDQLTVAVRDALAKGLISEKEAANVR